MGAERPQSGVKLQNRIGTFNIGPESSKWCEKTPKWCENPTEWDWKPGNGFPKWDSGLRPLPTNSGLEFSPLMPPKFGKGLEGP